MTNRLVIAADYLTYQEAIAQYQALQEADILPLVKTSGPPSFPFGDGIYFQLLVTEENLPDALSVLEVFHQKKPLMDQGKASCPRCGSGLVHRNTHMPWYKKLYYAGTCQLVCQHCGHSFLV